MLDKERKKEIANEQFALVKEALDDENQEVAMLMNISANLQMIWIEMTETNEQLAEVNEHLKEMESNYRIANQMGGA